MTSEQDLKRIFEAKRLDIPDNGFSQQVRRNLPERKGIFLQIIAPLSAITGFAIVVAIFGAMSIYDQMLDLITAVSHLQMPATMSLFTYLGGMATLGFIVFAAAGTLESD
jgi:hypothetical protein